MLTDICRRLAAPIEKGANDGQVTYAKDLNAALRGAVTSRPRSRTASNGAAKAGASGPGAKKRRKGKSASGAVSGIDGSEHPRSPGDRRGGANAQNWGLLEPVRPFLGPVVDIVAPVLTGNVVYGLLVGLLVASWFGFGFRGGGGAGSGVVGPGGGVGVPRWPYGYLPTTPDQYEEMWRREESELWDWLEERVGLDRLGDLTRPGSAAADNKPQAVRGGSGSGGAASAPKGEALSSKTLEERMREDRMSEREVDEAIRVTEEKLRLLRAVVERRKAAASRGASRDSESAADDRGGGPSMAADGGQQQAVL